MVVNKVEGYVLQSVQFKTYHVAKTKSETTLAASGLRFENFEAATAFAYSSGMEETHRVKKLIITTEIE